MTDNKNYDQLLYKRKNAWSEIGEKETEETSSFCRDYAKFLDASKTEREFAQNTVTLLEEEGYISLKSAFGANQKLHQGDKVYYSAGGKSVIMAVIGKESLGKGINMLGSHIDSPRLDLKQVPVFEDTDLAYLKTHYYGGVRKYQWLSIPLSLHGTIIRGDGEKIDVNIGEDDGDPVFVITDLLPHLAKDQNEKKLGEAFPAESLNILAGSVPMDAGDAKHTVKLRVLNLLNKKYGIVEKDLVNAELEVVPAFKSRDIGLDRGLMGAYGHDDRVCSYAGLRAILAAGITKKTSLCYLSDKEEIGSVGTTGAQSDILEYFIGMLLKLTEGKSGDLDVKHVLYNSVMLSGDVNAAVDPAFKSVHEKNNAMYLGKGVGISKYTGSRGKAGASDASAELMYMITKMLDDNQIIWQVGELGKTDEGGGGTIAKFAAKLGIEVLDVGVPLLGMHSPFEVASKVDIYMCYKAFKTFLENA
ncbi:MAG: aminopeptidase [Clostridia bacterium]|nr:aminopeptidase [Clostridia bacterium]